MPTRNAGLLDGSAVNARFKITAGSALATTRINLNGLDWAWVVANTGLSGTGHFSIAAIANTYDPFPDPDGTIDSFLLVGGQPVAGTNHYFFNRSGGVGQVSTVTGFVTALAMSFPFIPVGLELTTDANPGVSWFVLVEGGYIV
jgi:hypothetical protein